MRLPPPLNTEHYAAGTNLQKEHPGRTADRGRRRIHLPLRLRLPNLTQGSSHQSDPTIAAGGLHLPRAVPILRWAYTRRVVARCGATEYRHQCS